VKWRILDGHKAPVNTLSFNKDGKYLASFSKGDSTLRVWKITNTGFFGSLMGIQGKHYKKYEIHKKNWLKDNLNT